MLDIRAKQCVAVSSSWVRYFILTCNDKLAVQFYDSHHPQHPRVHHPKPDVCCYYPNTNDELFDIAIASDPGRFVHQYLYKKLPYVRIKPPCPPPQAGCCAQYVNDYPNLYLTLANLGNASCLAGTYTLTWQPMAQRWQMNQATVCNGNPLDAWLICQAGTPTTWILEVACGNVDFWTSPGATATATQEFPSFSMSFPTVTINSGCRDNTMAGNGTVGVTVTS